MLHLSGFPKDDVVVLGATGRLIVQPLDAQGSAVNSAAVSWTSSNPAVLAVAADGTFTAASSGVVLVSVASGAITASASLSVHDKIMVPGSGSGPMQVSVLDGAVVLSVPAAASGTVSQLDVGVALGAVPTPSLVASPAYEFGPSGLQFDKPITVTMTYGDVGTSAAAGSLVVGYLNVNSWVPVPGSTQDPATKTVSAPLTHFSTYAVVVDPVASVSVTPGTSAITIGQTVQLSATAMDASGSLLSGRAVTWTTSDATLATVSNSGLVTGVASGGPVTITATSEGKSAMAAITVSQAPVAAVSVTPPSGTLSVGQTVQLTATLTDGAGNTLSGRAVAWTSSAASIASVSASGLVTGVLAGGPVTITATSEGKSASASITVTQVVVPPMPVATVSVTPASGTVSNGQTLTLAAVTKDANGNVLTGRVVSWTSSNAAVAAVSGSGVVTGVAAGGPVTITATSEGRSGSAMITESGPAVASVTVAPASSTVGVGASTQFAATLQDGSGNVLVGRAVTWSTSDATIAKASASGLVTGVAVGGPVTITATSEGKSGSASLTVQGDFVITMTRPDSNTLFEDSLFVYAHVNSSFPLVSIIASIGALQAPVYVNTLSNNMNVLLLTASLPYGPVSLLVTATDTFGHKGVFTTPLQHVAHVASLAIAPATTTVSSGQTLQLTATPADAQGNALSGRTITWVTSDPSVATVSAAGLVTAVSGGGPITITATCEGKSATASITVTGAQAPVATVTLSTNAATLPVGLTKQLAATLKDANGNVLTGRTIVWSTSDPTLATVDPTGLVTGAAPGGVTITAASGGKSATASIGVLADQVSVEFPYLMSNTIFADSLLVHVWVNSTLPVASVTASMGTAQASLAYRSSMSEDYYYASLHTGSLPNGPAQLLVTATDSRGNVGTGTISLLHFPPVAAVAVMPATATVPAGQTLQLTATATDANNNVLSGHPVTWTTSNASVATVSAAGLVTGVGSGGPVTITATGDTKSGTAAITVTGAPTPVASVVLTPQGGAGLDVTQTVQLGAIVKDANGNVLTGRTITFASTNPTLATISSSGLLTALAPGSMFVTAICEGVLSPTVTVSISPVLSVFLWDEMPGTSFADSLVLTALTEGANPDRGTSVTASVGGIRLQLTQVINNSGTSYGGTLHTASLAYGAVTVVLTATDDHNNVATTSTSMVHVAPIATVTVTPPTGTVAAGLYLQLSATLRDANGNVLTAPYVVTWSSSDKTLATVDSTGLVRGTYGGSVTITASSGGLSSSAAITVTGAVKPP